MSEKKKKKLLPFVVIFAIAGIAFVISGFLIGCVKGENKSLIQTVIANGSCDETYNKEPYNIYRQATEEQVSINIADNGDYYSSVNSADSFCITVLDVGQGLSVMIICDGETALFDAGGPSENSDKYISSLLGSGFIDFKYCFISHYDADHCNYMNGVMETCSIGTLILPDYEANTKTYSSMIRHRDENGIPYEYAQVGTTYELGEADITVIGPNGYDHENENNNSICIRIN